MRKISLLLISAFLFAGAVNAADLRPLSPQDYAKLQELLKSFDPQSYEIHVRVQDPKLGARPFKAGLANLRQSNTVRPTTAARPINEINIFRPPIVLIVINIFRDAATSNLDPVDPAGKGHLTALQKTRAQELNQLLAKYYVP